MSASIPFSGMVLQIASEVAPPSAEDGSLLSEVGTYGMEFVLHVAFIWSALIIISLIVFGYRKAMKGGGKRDYPDTYEEDLRAMRRGEARHD